MNHYIKRIHYSVLFHLPCGITICIFIVINSNLWKWEEETEGENVQLNYALCYIFVLFFNYLFSRVGLRGAVAFALALLIKQHKVAKQPMFVTTTIAVIYFTVFVQGITIKPLVKILNVKRAEKKKPTMNERIHERVSVAFNTNYFPCEKNYHIHA